MNFDIQMLAYVLDSEGHKSLIISQREYAQLKELIEVLDPFLEATSLTRRENCHCQCCCALCPHSAQSSAGNKRKSQILWAAGESSGELHESKVHRDLQCSDDARM